MNIEEAKVTVERALQAYFARDENGSLLIPLYRQRPLLLLGPPGIGKTAIMEQIAKNCGVGLVAYTMTHHTRQSAMGLPEITTQQIEGKKVHTTEYTMSEIIASMYQCQKRTGKQGGILFLDEINCVSETLAPVMLQLLQEKKFGNQKIPENWLIVAAGNPPEYNKSVREFDVATLDRVRKIEIEPELSVWFSYAEKNQVHESIRSYLAAHAERFYSVRQEDGRKEFVTARGWEDLSAVLKSYETLHFPVTEALIGQYLQEEKTAEDFFCYYRIYTKYGQDYDIEAILAGTMDENNLEIRRKMAKEAPAEERVMLLSLLEAALERDGVQSRKRERVSEGIRENLTQLTSLWKHKTEETFAFFLEQKEQAFKVRVERSLISKEEQETAVQVMKKLKRILQVAEAYRKTEKKEQMELFQTVCELEEERSRKEKKEVALRIGRANRFLKESFANGAELTLFEARLARREELREFLIEGEKESDEL